MSTRADQIFENFAKFHRANPEVWQKFKEFTQTLISAGRSNYSADAVCHRIRWHYATQSKGEDFKINNNYTALYARMFMVQFPEHAGFFRLRHRQSEFRPERPDAIEGATSADVGIDDEITRKLKALLNAEVQRPR